MDAIDLLEAGGLALMDWQALLLEAWMGVGIDGKWAAKNCGNSTPRQNGKTRIIQGRALAEMLLYGGTVLYTSQLQKTSTETFHEMRELVEGKALRRYLAPNGVKTALGREEIHMKNGARMKFLARTRNGGDGQHGSLLIFDEAQAMDEAAQESFLPAISACRTPRGPQVIYNGTPPKDGDYGLVFERIRNDALDGRSSRTAWTEWGAGYGGNPPDPADRALWERCNPSYGVLISPDTVEGESEAMERAKFAHQRLGWWTGDRKAQTVMPQAEWAACEVGEAPESYQRLCYGVRFSADGALVALSVAVRHARGVHFEFVRQEPLSGGVRWLVDWVAERNGQFAEVAIDGRAAADDFAAKLVDAGVPKRAVRKLSTADAAAAASAMLNAVTDGEATHVRDDVLTESALKATRRKLGSAGAFGFGGESPEIIESAAIALYSAMTTKRDPSRKAVVF